MTAGDFQDSKQRFIEEASTLARFQHPNIVHVYDAFEEHNTAYMVMEFLKGNSLQSLLDKQSTIPEKEAVGYIEQVGQALSVVHQSGILHRDIKPDNILITDDKRVVLIDFGAAREFASASTRRMTALLTPGYAPLEQYGQQAKFGTYTDVYALGATLYHLLTGEIPVQVTDRVAGVTLMSPQRKNPQISRVISDAVMWAMEIQVVKRPQSAVDFLTALRGTQKPAPAHPSNPYNTLDDLLKAIDRLDGPQKSPPSNPYTPRIKQIFQVLAAPLPPPPPHALDARLQELNSTLTKITLYKPGLASLCPGCRKATLVRVLGQSNGSCPICSKVRLTRRQWDYTRCPACCKGALTAYKLNAPMFCGVCGISPVIEEKQRKLGITISVHYRCPTCEAEYEKGLGEKAKLLKFSQDPTGNGAKYVNQTLQFVQWHRLSQRKDDYLSCNECTAQFDCEENDRATLVHLSSDASDIIKKHLGKTYYRSGWAKIAQGLSLSAGNLGCPSCHAELEYDDANQTLTLLSIDETKYPWTKDWLGQPIAIPRLVPARFRQTYLKTWPSLPILYP